MLAHSDQPLRGGETTNDYFADSPPIAYVEGLLTGNLMDDPAPVAASQTSYAPALSDALSHQESLALVKAVAEEHAHGQQ